MPGKLDPASSLATPRRPKLPPIASAGSLWSRRPVLRALRRRGPVRGRSGPVLLRRPVLRSRASRRWPATRWPGRNRPVVGRTRPDRLDGRPPVIRWPIVIWRPAISRRPISRTTNRMGEPRPRARPIDGSGWPVIRRPVAPIASVPWAIAINHRARAIIRPWGPIAAIPAAPRATVVIDPPAAPVPSPTTPAPGLADEQRGDADGNPERD
jgi:hypothetical protein